MIGWELVRAFQQPLAVDGRDLMISISVGASVFPDHGRDAEALLRAADAALFRAKALGRSQLTVVSPELFRQLQPNSPPNKACAAPWNPVSSKWYFNRRSMPTTLTTDLVEALLRWRLPDGRLVHRPMSS